MFFSYFLKSMKYEVKYVDYDENNHLVLGASICFIKCDDTEYDDDFIIHTSIEPFYPNNAVDENDYLVLCASICSILPSSVKRR